MLNIMLTQCSLANSADPDQMLHNVASDQSLLLQIVQRFVFFL